MAVDTAASGLKAPRKAAFDKNNLDPPLWLGVRPPLTQKQIHTIDRGFRKRAQSVEAVDRMIGKIEDTLRAHGLASNTYIFFSSDNGYHMGEYRLNPGKMTAFDTDIRVPLVVAGPGVPAGKASDAAASTQRAVLAVMETPSSMGWRTVERCNRLHALRLL